MKLNIVSLLLLSGCWSTHTVAREQLPRTLSYRGRPTELGDAPLDEETRIRVQLTDGRRLPRRATPVRELHLTDRDLTFVPQLSVDPLQLPLATVESVTMTNPPCSVGGPVLTGIGAVLLGTGAALLATAGSGDYDEETDEGNSMLRIMGHVYGGLLAAGVGVVFGATGGIVWGVQCSD